MKRSLLALGLGLALAATAQAADIRLVIHGGAGTMAREDFTPERAAKYHEGLQQALQAGYAVLEQGGTAVDAVKAAINQMELNPNFNAGRGAVFTSEGKNELDSSIMDGKTLSAGAVAGVTNVKHPINCADLVRTKSPHVMMATKGAEEFCAKNGAETVDPKWFFTDFRYQQLQKAKEKEQIILDHDGDHPKTANAELFIDPMMYDYKYGTVGAVALDQGRQHCRGHVDRRHDQQALRPRGRLAHHRGRHLRQQRNGGRFLHGLGRNVHPYVRRLQRACPLQAPRPGRSEGR